MIEFVVVDYPAIKPQRCVACNSSTGPLVDTLAEQWGDRIYLCKLCVKRSAKLLGFVRGDKADQLDNAMEVVAAKDSELDILTAEVRDLRGKLGHEQKKVQAQATLLEDAQNRERTRAHLAAEIAGIASQLQTVGDPVLETA